MVHFTAFELVLRTCNPPGLDNILAAAWKLAASWQGLLHRGDVEILCGPELTGDILVMLGLSKVAKVQSDAIGNIYRADTGYLRRFIEASAIITETSTFTYEGITGRIVISEEGEFKQSLIAALAENGGN